MPKKNNSKDKQKTINIARTAIEENILNGKIHANQRLIEEDIAADLGLSRTPVREALKQLEMKGIVSRLSTRGLIVTPITEQSIKDTFEVREVLEVRAIRLACERATVENIKKAQQFIESHHKRLIEIKTIGAERLYRKAGEPDWNDKFHNELYNASGNVKLIRYIHEVRDVQQIVYMSRFFSESEFILFIHQHVNILDGVSRKDKNIAEKAVVEHLNTIAALYIKYLRNQ